MVKAIRLADNYHETKWVVKANNSIVVYYDWTFISNVLALARTYSIESRQMMECSLELAADELDKDKADMLEEAFYCFFSNDHQNKSLEYKIEMFEMLWRWASNEEI